MEGCQNYRNSKYTALYLWSTCRISNVLIFFMCQIQIRLLYVKVIGNEYWITTNWLYLYILNGFFVTEKLKLRQFEFCDFEITQLLSIQFIIKELSNYIIINHAIILKTNLVEIRCGYDVWVQLLFRSIKYTH